MREIICHILTRWLTLYDKFGEKGAKQGLGKGRKSKYRTLQMHSVKEGHLHLITRAKPRIKTKITKTGNEGR